MPAKETPNCPVRANIISTGLFCHFDHREKSSLFLFAASRYSKKKHLFSTVATGRISPQPIPLKQTYCNTFLSKFQDPMASNLSIASLPL
ncbi:hypothetical protein [Desulfobulbus propionicus]